MLTKPDPKALRALYSFSNHAGWSDVDKFLRDELHAVHTQMSLSHDEVILRQMQGRAQFLQEFLDTVASAATVLEKLRASTL